MAHIAFRISDIIILVGAKYGTILKLGKPKACIRLAAVGFECRRIGAGVCVVYNKDLHTLVNSSLCHHLAFSKDGLLGLNCAQCAVEGIARRRKDT
jgi:hypothetical protein